MVGLARRRIKRRLTEDAVDMSQVGILLGPSLSTKWRGSARPVVASGMLYWLLEGHAGYAGMPDVAN
jgi:hypothetical protein